MPINHLTSTGQLHYNELNKLERDILVFLHDCPSNLDSIRRGSSINYWDIDDTLMSLIKKGLVEVEYSLFDEPIFSQNFYIENRKK